MTTRKQQLLEALKDGDKPDDLICFYQHQAGIRDEGDQQPILRCRFGDLPEREFDDGFGGLEGEPCIAFSPNWVYVCQRHDGAEDMVAVPRHSGVVTFIPWIGGG